MRKAIPRTFATVAVLILGVALPVMLPENPLEKRLAAIGLIVLAVLLFGLAGLYVASRPGRRKSMSDDGKKLPGLGGKPYGKNPQTPSASPKPAIRIIGGDFSYNCGTGLVVEGSAEIEGATATHNDGHGMQLDGQDQTLKDVTATHNKGDGVHIAQSNDDGEDGGGVP